VAHWSGGAEARWVVAVEVVEWVERDQQVQAVAVIVGIAAAVVAGFDAAAVGLAAVEVAVAVAAAAAALPPLVEAIPGCPLVGWAK
jgi:hypothetical protein